MQVEKFNYDGSLLDFHQAIETSQPMLHEFPAHPMPVYAGAALQAIH